MNKILSHVKHFIGGKWEYAKEIPTTPGDFRWYNDDTAISGYRTWNPEHDNSDQIERDWVKSEIARTDEFAKLRDYPEEYWVKMEPYRQALRDYNCDGNRPEVPITKNGNPL